MKLDQEEMTTWRREIEKIADGDQLIASTLTNAEMDVEFDCQYGSKQGKPFTAWGKKYVYFPVANAGAEWVGKVPRNPCIEVTKHQGG